MYYLPDLIFTNLGKSHTIIQYLPKNLLGNYSKTNLTCLTKVSSSIVAFESSPEHLSLGFRLLDGWFDVKADQRPKNGLTMLQLKEG